MSPASLDTQPLAAHVQHFARARVLCLGDVMIDRFIEGAVKRISPESPVPVFNAGAQLSFPGGAANVARNVFALGAQCTLIGVIGDDAAGRELAETIKANTAIEGIFITCADRPTTEKTRFVTQGQHVLRVDREVTTPVPPAVATGIAREVERLIACHDVLVLSDYAKGVLTADVIARVIALATAAGKPVIVDPKADDFAKYAGATVLTPNTAEMHNASGIDPTADADAIAAGRFGLQRAGAEAVLITRGKKGMMLVPRDGEAVQIASTGREVFDVVGAGDTVVAAIAVALAAGTTVEAAARIANTAAGIVVGKRGTAVVSPDELIAALESQARGPGRRGAPVMLTLEETARYARARKAEGKKVGFTNGVFDILHPGHISILQFSRDACDCLIVGLNSDASVKRLKGPTRPINAENDRSIVVGALGMVDVVVIFDTDTPLELITAVQPDVLIKGADYRIDNVVGADLVLGRGGTVLLAPLVPGLSSTQTIAKAQL